MSPGRRLNVDSDVRPSIVMVIDSQVIRGSRCTGIINHDSRWRLVSGGAISCIVLGPTGIRALYVGHGSLRRIVLRLDVMILGPSSQISVSLLPSQVATAKVDEGQASSSDGHHYQRTADGDCDIRHNDFFCVQEG